MIRIVDGHVEVYFIQHMSGTAAPYTELSFSIEEYLLIAREAKTIEELRLAVIEQAKRVNIPASVGRAIRSAQAAVAKVGLL